VTNPTCLAAGFTTNTCSRCPDSFVNNNVPALGHAYEWVVQTPAAPEVAGVEIGTCRNCNDTQTRTIPALPPADGTGEPVDPDPEDPVGDGVLDVLPEADSAKKIPPASFTDVPSASIAFNAVSWAEFHGYVTGGNGLFNPTGNMSRAQFALVLYRYDKEPKGSVSHSFFDVPTASIANEAISWANENGIVTGQAGRFNPTGQISRAQMILMLHRYDKYVGATAPGRPPTGQPDPTILDQFEDKALISTIALDAMAWGVTNKLITGGNGIVNPTGNVTRAQVVLILYRYDTEVK